jgi:hypothetical protein
MLLKILPFALHTSSLSEQYGPVIPPRHWVPFSSPPTTRRATVEVFDPASTRLSFWCPYCCLAIHWFIPYVVPLSWTGCSSYCHSGHAACCLRCIRQRLGYEANEVWSMRKEKNVRTYNFIPSLEFLWKLISQTKGRKKYWGCLETGCWVERIFRFKGDEVIGGWRKFRNKQIYLNFSTNVIIFEHPVALMYHSLIHPRL